MIIVEESLEDFLKEDINLNRSRAMSQRHFDDYTHNLYLKQIKRDLPDFDPDNFLTYLYDRHKSPKVEDIKDTLKEYLEDDTVGKRKFKYELTTSALAHLVKDVIEWLKFNNIIRK